MHAIAANFERKTAFLLTEFFSAADSTVAAWYGGGGSEPPLHLIMSGGWSSSSSPPLVSPSRPPLPPPPPLLSGLSLTTPPRPPPNLSRPKSFLGRSLAEGLSDMADGGGVAVAEDDGEEGTRGVEVWHGEGGPRVGMALARTDSSSATTCKIFKNSNDEASLLS